MEMKKKLRAFFTLARKGDGGFTLVELIVVIAIIAILGGVATVGYSGYVKKANMQADITLASEIEQALILAHYSGTLTPGTSVVVYYGDTDVSVGDESANAAMVATFGEGYAESLRLKYDGWTGTAGGVNVEQINSSSFGEENLDTMMEDVSVLSGVLANYFSTGDVTYNPLKNYMDANGITTTDSQVLANLAVLQVADSVVGADSAKFVSDYSTYSPTELAAQMQKDNQSDLDKLSAYAVAYAQMEGMINYIQKNATTDADKAAIAEIRNSWATGSANLADVTSVDQLLQSTQDMIDDKLGSYAYSYYNSDSAANDANAFLSYMTGVNEVAPSITSDLTALASPDYYKGNTATNIINNYISAAELLGGYSGSAIVVLYDGQDVACYPMDYTK